RRPAGSGRHPTGVTGPDAATATASTDTTTGTAAADDHPRVTWLRPLVPRACGSVATTRSVPTPQACSSGGPSPPAESPPARSGRGSPHGAAPTAGSTTPVPRRPTSARSAHQEPDRPGT